jgi:hypothetical protein
LLYKFINNLKPKKMRTRKLLTTLAIVSVVFIAGCNCNDEERWSGWPGNDGNSGGNSPGTPAQLAPGAVDLGLAGNFVILSKSGITDVPLSDITGDIGTSPITGAAITGVTCPEVTGTVYTVDAAYPFPLCNVIAPAMLTTAVLNMEAAYTDAAGRTATSAATTDVGAGTLIDLTLAAGVYEWGSTVNIPTDLTLNGSATDVWIFNINGTLDMAVGKSVILTGGALAQNIFWRVSGAVTLLTDSHFEGTILAKENIAMQNGASINGRLLAQTAVTLIMNTVTFSGTSGSGGGTKPPKPCRDFVTGGGWIKGNLDKWGHKCRNNDKATFGVSGGIMNGKLWGQLSYNDHGRNGVSVKSTSVTGYTRINATTREITGLAKVNGHGSFTYTVVVVDNGEPGHKYGHSNDSFSIELSNNYSASGTLDGGNIQLHMKCGDSHDKGDKEDYYDRDERDGHNNCDNNRDWNRDHDRD